MYDVWDLKKVMDDARRHTKSVILSSAIAQDQEMTRRGIKLESLYGGYFGDFQNFRYFMDHLQCHSESVYSVSEPIIVDAGSSQGLLDYPKSEVLAWYDDNFMNVDSKFFLEYFVPQRKQKKIWARAIYPDKPGTRDLLAHSAEFFIRGKIIKSPDFKMDIEINLYGSNKLGIVSYPEQIAVIIESQKIFNAQKNIFEVLWNCIGE